jgi:hypothetical protein
VTGADSRSPERSAPAALLRRATRAFRALDLEQKAAAVGALLLVVSTFGPFSFVELAELLIAGGVLALLFARAERRSFELPFADGTLIAAAGVWAAGLIVARLLERSLGQNLLALACAAILFLAGVRERAKHPPAGERPSEPGPAPARPEPREPRPGPPAEAAEAETEPLPPPEFEPYRPEEGEQLRLSPPTEATEEQQPATPAARRTRRDRRAQRPDG